MHTPLRRAALVLAVGLLPALAGCGAAPTAEVTASAAPPGTAVAVPATRPVVPAAASRAAVRPAFGDLASSLAAKYEGTPYAWGGSSPRGFDCSGFTRYVYGKLGKPLPRVSRDQYRTVHKVGRQVQKGELIFLHTRSGRVYHVGIYAGDRTIWHASRPGVPVRRDRIWTSSVFYGRVR